MGKKLFFQLESLVRRLQISRLKKLYPDLEGLKIGQGILWQHPVSGRFKILAKYRQKLGLV